MRTETKPAIVLSTGKVVRHFAMANGATSAECEPCMDDNEWQEYCSLIKASNMAFRGTGVKS